MRIKESKMFMRLLSLFLAVILTFSVATLLDFRGEGETSNNGRNEIIRSEIGTLEPLNKEHESQENDEIEDHESEDK